jgi:hypothetical protein
MDTQKQLNVPLHVEQDVLRLDVPVELEKGGGKGNFPRN